MTRRDNSFGEYLRRLRLRTGLSVVEVASRAKIDPCTFWKNETGKVRTMQAKTRLRLCRFYGITPEMMINMQMPGESPSPPADGRMVVVEIHATPDGDLVIHPGPGFIETILRRLGRVPGGS